MTFLKKLNTDLQAISPTTLLIAIDKEGQVSDLEGYESDLFTYYKIYGIPTIYVLDQERRILSRNSRGEALELLVMEYLD